jgi:type I restriction enzyme M protein
MPSKRDVLVQLSREELISVVEKFELEVADRRKKDDLLEAVAASKKATLAEILPGLSRERLKELCVALGLDDSGREKTILIERLLGTGKASAEPAKPAPPAKGKATTPTIEIAPGEKLTRDKLEGYLWSAADILRGSIDSCDYKNYILGMLFLKRLSDRFVEECEALQGNRDANPEDPDEHDFFVPKRARFTELQKTATNLGEALNKACAALEDSKADPAKVALATILEEAVASQLGIVDWVNREDVQKDIRRLVKRQLRAAQVTEDKLDPLAEQVVDLLKRRQGRE